MNTLPIPRPPIESALARDELLEALQEQSFEELVNSSVAEIRTLADGPPAEGFRRQIQNLAIIHDDQELASILRDSFRNLLIYDPGKRGEDPVIGQEPISASSVAIAFAVGVASGLAAAAIWDWATDQESTHFIQVDGVTIELTIDDDGRILRQRVVNAGSGP